MASRNLALQSCLDEVVAIGESQRFPVCPFCNKLRSAFMVTRKSKGWVYWCHRCHAKGFKPATGFTPTQAKKLIRREAPVVYLDSVTLPEDFTSAIPFKGLQWLGQYGISQELATDYGIGFSPKLNRVILPVYEGEKLVYWQGRSLDREGEYTPPRPKYKNVICKKQKPFFVINKFKNKATVLVEDIISAICVAEAGYNSVSLLGSYIDDALILKLLKGNVKSAILWLDPDKRKDAIKYQKRLTTFGIATQVIPLTKKDPKDYTSTEVVSIIGGDNAD